MIYGKKKLIVKFFKFQINKAWKKIDCYKRKFVAVCIKVSRFLDFYFEIIKIYNLLANFREYQLNFSQI